MIEAVRLDIVERGIEYQHIAIELAPFGRDGTEQDSPEPAAALAFRGYQVVDIDEPAMDQVFCDPIPSQRDGNTLAPRRQDAVTGFTLARDPRRKLIGTGKMRPQQRHNRKAGGDLRIGFGMTQVDVAHA